MKSFLIAASFTIAASCQNQLSTGIQKTNTGEYMITDVMDFHVMRLSGSRVQVSWHAEAKENQNDFVLMRKLGNTGIFEKVSTIKPKQASIISDYTITDINSCEDSSYYSIMQVDGKGVKYFSQFKGVKGIKR